MILQKRKKKYTCSECGEVHSGWPALGYISPAYYHCLSPEEKENNATLDSDFCIVHEGDETYFFIRTVFIQKVNNGNEDLEYGLWVSLSETSFNDYKANFNNENYERVFFGWLASQLPDYDSETPIPMEVITKPGNERPEIVPHWDTDHPFVRDYYNGISSHEAQRRVDAMMPSN